jgi:5-methylthioadenosine/S-adenosylhomocysteine deaminase
MRTLLSGGVVVTCDEQHTIYDPGDVLYEGEWITFVGSRYDGPYDVRIPATGKLLMPGLINAHTHSGMSILRSLADDADLLTFLHERVWPCEVCLEEEEVYAGSVLSAVEMLKCGVTTYVDMYFFPDALRRAALDTGARALITPTILPVPPLDRVLGTWEEQLARALDFCRHSEGEAGRIHTGIGPHAPYTVPLQALSEIAAEARKIGRPVNTHLVETAWERETFNARGLGSTAAGLQDIGFFDGPVIAAHSIWLDPGDILIYRDHAVGAAHCPQSNAKLGCGVAPVAAMLAQGVHVGLGTDGAATNNNLDLWEDVRLAPLLAKVTALDPKPLPAAQALWMATRIGALAIHRSDLGVLAPGYRADMLMFDLNDTTTVPVFEPRTYISHLVYSMDRRLVDRVWVNGELVVVGGEIVTVDEEQVRRNAQRAALGLFERALV